MGLFDNLFKSKPDPGDEGLVEAARRITETEKARLVEAEKAAKTAGQKAPGSGNRTAHAPVARAYSPRSLGQAVPPRQVPTGRGPAKGVRFGSGAEGGRPQEIRLLLDDVLPRIPPEFLNDTPRDGRKEIRFRVEDVTADIARGRAAVALVRIAEQAPEIFKSPVAPTDETLIRLPLQKLVEQIGFLPVRSAADPTKGSPLSVGSPLPSIPAVFNRALPAKPREGAQGAEPSITQPAGRATPNPAVARSSRMAEPPVPAPDFQTAGIAADAKISLSLKEVLKHCPKELICAPLPPIADTEQISVAFGSIERQLRTGQVEISSVRFIFALPPHLQHCFQARDGIRIPLPLDEVLRNLPSVGSRPGGEAPPKEDNGITVEPEVVAALVTPTSQEQIEATAVNLGSEGTVLIPDIGPSILSDLSGVESSLVTVPISSRETETAARDTLVEGGSTEFATAVATENLGKEEMSPPHGASEAGEPRGDSASLAPIPAPEERDDAAASALSESHQLWKTNQEAASSEWAPPANSTDETLEGCAPDDGLSQPAATLPGENTPPEVEAPPADHPSEGVGGVEGSRPFTLPKLIPPQTLLDIPEPVLPLSSASISLPELFVSRPGEAPSPMVSSLPDAGADSPAATIEQPGLTFPTAAPSIPTPPPPMLTGILPPPLILGESSAEWSTQNLSAALPGGSESQTSPAISIPSRFVPPPVHLASSSITPNMPPAVSNAPPQDSEVEPKLAIPAAASFGEESVESPQLRRDSSASPFVAPPVFPVPPPPVLSPGTATHLRETPHVDPPPSPILPVRLVSPQVLRPLVAPPPLFGVGLGEDEFVPPAVISTEEPVPLLEPAIPPSRPLELARARSLLKLPGDSDLAQLGEALTLLPGVYACLLMVRHETADAGDIREGFDLARARTLASRLAESIRAADNSGTPIEHVTVFTAEGCSSIFARGNAIICALHRTRAFLPGVCEKLSATVEALAEA